MVKEIQKGDTGVNKDKVPVTFKVVVPAAEAKPVAPLGPILGQYKVNLLEFCKDFNAKSIDYDSGTLLRVSVTKLPNEKMYAMRIMPPSLTFLLQCTLIPVDQESGWVELTAIKRVDKKIVFDIIRVYSLLHDLPLLMSAKAVLGFLRSTAIRYIG